MRDYTDPDWLKKQWALALTVEMARQERLAKRLSFQLIPAGLLTLVVVVVWLFVIK